MKRFVQKKSFVDDCLKRYLGRTVKCESVEELSKVRDGVTPDCYSYSNYMFRHLREKDYTLRACIGNEGVPYKNDGAFRQGECTRKNELDEVCLQLAEA